MSFDPERMTNTLWPLDAPRADQTARIEPNFPNSPQVWGVRYLPDNMSVGIVTNPEPGVWTSKTRCWDTSYYALEGNNRHPDFSSAVQHVLDTWLQDTNPRRP